MQEIAITVKSISKKFRLFNSSKERFLEAFHPFNKKYHKEFWALQDVSFDVPKGKTVGIIGRNGSGKSTLLQILCAILRPTSGEVAVKGRISALLELGSGFNPEFTGRQNVLMKGLLMGFTEKQMKQRLPEIEAFADIGEFMDQPIKIYSSGMSVRLAFACAVNVDPDILIIDEALAVGDAKFQHKCYGKFLEYQKAGKTILFVSHNTEAVVRHCDTAILLEKGRLLEKGEPKTIANYYTDLLFTGSYSKDSPEIKGEASVAAEQKLSCDKENNNELERFLENASGADRCMERKSYNKNEYRYGDGRAKIIDYLIVEGDRYDPVMIASGAMIELYVKIKYNEKIDFPMTGFAIKTLDGLLVCGVNTVMKKVKLMPALKNSLCIFQWRVKMDLSLGEYFIDFGSGEYQNCVSIPLDRRYGLAHLSVQSNIEPCGFVSLETEFNDLLRKPVGVILAK